VFRRAVQCRDHSVVDRLLDRGHPNKVSMRKEKKRNSKRRARGSRYLCLWVGPAKDARLSETLDLVGDSPGLTGEQVRARGNEGGQSALFIHVLGHHSREDTGQKAQEPRALTGHVNYVVSVLYHPAISGDRWFTRIQVGIRYILFRRQIAVKKALRLVKGGILQGALCIHEMAVIHVMHGDESTT